ncbi:MAG: DUF3047 domain-containing protein [Alphaproteobacteria bacterium]
MHCSRQILISLLLLGAMFLPESGFAGQNGKTIEAKELDPWKEHVFKGKTPYSIDRSSGANVIKASCINTASALYQENVVDLSKTPVLRWSWKVEDVHTQLQEKEKSGDDYPARVYVVYTPSRLTPWRTLAIDYVWSNNQDIGSIWPNAFTSNAIMVALQSGKTRSSQAWKHEARNVKQDFKKFFDIDLDTIDGLAIMTDCDNTGLSMTGFYKNIRFSSE